MKETVNLKGRAVGEGGAADQARESGHDAGLKARAAGAVRRGRERKRRFFLKLPQIVLPEERSVRGCWAILFLLLIPLLAAWFGRCFETGRALLWCFTHPGAWLLEAALLMIVTLPVFAAARSLCAAWCVTAVPAVLIGAINHYKLEMNGSELVYSDLSMIGKLGEIAGYVKGQFHVCTALILLPLFVILIALFLIAVDLRLKKPQTVRIAAAPAALLLFALFFLWNTGTVWVRAAANGDTNSEIFVAENGAVLGLYFGYTNKASFDPEEHPETVEEVRIEVLEHRETEPEPEPESEAPVTPNVIFLMSESFFDVTELPNVSFSEDPLPNYHRLAEKCRSGRFLSSTYRGGTAYVEQEVLTAVCSQLLADGDKLTTLEPQTVYSGLPCITEVFLGYGYETTFLHSHNSELYNRSVIYPQLGFDQVIFSDEFRHRERSGGYISDMALTEEILERCGNRDAPQFVFAVSMENHQPYSGKYESTGVKAKSDGASAAALELLENYAQGVRNADAALGALIEALEGADEPYMVVFFGDHRPNLQVDSDSSVYSSLGFSGAQDTVSWTTEELAEMLSTNYLIWTNYEEDIPEEELVREESSVFLGLDVLKRLGFSLSEYYEWLDRVVRPNLLMYRPRLFADAEGGLYSKIPEDKEKCMQGYEAAVRNIVYGSNDIFDHSVNRIQAVRPENPTLIAHAGGAVFGYRLTNSLEALEQAYENGFRFFELDFALTSDRHLVCIHDWDSMGERLLGYPGRRTLSEFRKGPVMEDLTLLDITDVLSWLEEHPGCYIITDGKTENPEVLKIIHDRSGQLRSRFIPQIYSFEEYDTAQKYGFTNIILTLYQRGSSAGVADFVEEHSLWAVTMPESLLTEELLKSLNRLGTASYVHSVNDRSFFEEWKDKGLTGIYTDHFRPDHWETD